jgi:hypothetical protein
LDAVLVTYMAGRSLCGAGMPQRGARSAGLVRETREVPGHAACSVEEIERRRDGTMSDASITKREEARLAAQEWAELASLAERVRGRLHRTVEDLLAIGADLLRAKQLLGHGHFGGWLDAEFGLSRRSAEQFMAAARRFGSRCEAVSHLPAGALLELSAPSVPDELVERVVAGEVPPSVSAIREERAGNRTAELPTPSPGRSSTTWSGSTARA